MNDDKVSVYKVGPDFKRNNVFAEHSEPITRRIREYKITDSQPDDIIFEEIGDFYIQIGKINKDTKSASILCQAMDTLNEGENKFKELTREGNYSWYEF